MLILILLASSSLHAAVGCLSKTYDVQHERFYEHCDPVVKDRYHVYRDEINTYPSDSKTWHPIACTCPCDKYEAAFFHYNNSANGYCVKCHHRGPAGRRVQHTVLVGDEATLARQFPALERIIAQRQHNQ